MAIDRDTALELADLTRQLATARSLLAYEQTQHITTRLSSAEDLRQLRVRLLHLEPEYDLLLSDYNSQLTYTTSLEEALSATSKRSAWFEASATRKETRMSTLEEKLREEKRRCKDAEETNATMEQKNAALETKVKELEERLKSKLREEGEAGALAAELTEARSATEKLEEENKVLRTKAEKLAAVMDEHKKLRDEHKKLRMTAKSLEAELIEQAAASEELKGQNEAATAKQEKDSALLKDTQKELDTARNLLANHKTELLALKEKLQDHVDRLAKSLTSKAATKAALESELATLRLELDDAHKTAEDTAKKAKKDIVALEKQLTALKAAPPKDNDSAAALKREIRARKEAESALDKLTEQHDTLASKLAATTSALESTRAKLAAAKKKSAAASAAVSSDTDSRKRPVSLTMEDLEQSAKRVRKEGPKVSDFSITPFLRKTGGVTEEEQTPSMMMDASVVSALPPAIADGKEPARLLLAGATRKKKTSTSAVEAEPPKAETPSPEPELVKVKPKAKKGKGKAVDPPVELKIPEPAGIFDSPSSLPVPVSKANGIFDSPSSIPVPIAKTKKVAKKAPAEKKEKAPVEKKDKVPAEKKDKAPVEKKKPVAGKKPGKGKGIMPTVFDDDDGTGRLVMNNVGTQEGAGAGPAVPSKRLQKEEDVFGLGLVPVLGTFGREISPAKKRPDALKGLFAGKKK